MFLSCICIREYNMYVLLPFTDTESLAYNQYSVCLFKIKSITNGIIHHQAKYCCCPFTITDLLNYLVFLFLNLLLCTTCTSSLFHFSPLSLLKSPQRSTFHFVQACVCKYTHVHIRNKTTTNISHCAWIPLQYLPLLHTYNICKAYM